MISVDWSVTPWLITIPKSDLTLISGTKYNLTVDVFWQLLRDFSDTIEALPRPILYSRISATSSTSSITEIDSFYYALQFEDGVYSVNIINGNTNIREVEIKNTVSVNTNNTTGFIDPVFLEAGIFNEKVILDIVSGVPNTPDGKTSGGSLIGTLDTPVNNLSDARDISILRGSNTIEIRSSMTLIGSALDFSAGYKFIGASSITVSVVIDTSVNIQNCEFLDMKINGTLDGGNVLRQCIVENLQYVNGFIYDCAISGTIVLGGGLPSSIIKSWSFPNIIPTIDMGGSGNLLLATDWSGNLLITNCTGGSGITSIRSNGGKITFDSSVLGGTFEIYGHSNIVDNSTGTALIIDNSGSLTLTEQQQLFDTLTKKQFVGLK